MEDRQWEWFGVKAVMIQKLKMVNILAYFKWVVGKEIDLVMVQVLLLKQRLHINIGFLQEEIGAPGLVSGQHIK